MDSIVNNCDQFGLGVGDSVLNTGNTGLCNYLWSIMKQNATVRRNWIMFNCSEFEATSKDWLPNSETVPISISYFIKHSYQELHF
ncbi:hypothetical protein AYI68_g6769 [Smittium mucronatum]|uniref:Uncharacterized protein n=1 Tax=Smittium mucronatum TaxID=133383 RepID=A0A1R0GQL2_9FUNG|nr:hypothetical protein AYI68_g6769 [Smittium mucronatum]